MLAIESPARTVRILRALDRLGQIGAAIEVAGDPPRRPSLGLIDELGSLTFARAQRPLERARLRAQCPRGARGRRRRDPLPQPPRVHRHHVRRRQARRPDPVPQHRLRRPAARGRVRARGRLAAGPRRGVRGAGRRRSRRATGGCSAWTDGERALDDARGADRGSRRRDPAAAVAAGGRRAADQRHDRHAEGRAASPGPLACTRSARCCRRSPTAAASRRSWRRRCSTGSGSRRWCCR